MSRKRSNLVFKFHRLIYTQQKNIIRRDLCIEQHTNLGFLTCATGALSYVTAQYENMHHPSTDVAQLLRTRMFVVCSIK